ncbi:MAG: vanadium-dependent haloperoxidase [Sphingomonadales bacterium]
MKFNYCLIAVLICLSACTKNSTEKIILKHDILTECNVAIQNAVVVDRIPPPVASRRYYYAGVAAYESLVPFSKDFISLAGQLRELKSIPKPDTSLGYCLDLVAMCAHTYTSKKLVFQEDSIVNFRERKLAYYKKNIPSKTFKNSVSYGDSVGAAIFRWAKSDNYSKTRGTGFYLVKNADGKWEPTLPEFGDALEPNWFKIRTAVVPSASAITIPAPEPFSNNKNSRFFKIAKQVYDQSKNQDSSFLAIAKYWDDNPNSSIHYGHATIGVLRISPPGHWLSIFSNIAKQKQYDLFKSAEGIARLSAVIFDAFIVTWDTKYKTEYVRPETVIRKYIDSSWTPAIQTPPFPEYPSAHSVVSSSSATLLTSMFGEYAFTDSTQIEFGLGARSFRNFREAANEACMSRLYGGIHFIDGIEKGKMMGNLLGEYHLKHVKTRK